MTDPVKTVTLTKEEFDTLVTAYYEVAEVVWNAPDLAPCWTQVAELDELVEPIVKAVEDAA